MPSKIAFAAVLAAAALPLSVRAEVLSGLVEFTGHAPAVTKLDRSADAFCAKKAADDETVVVKGGKLVNVWVHVTKGAPETKAPADAPEVMVDQQDCTYHPRVQAAVVGQKIVAKNNDPILHNVHTYLGAATVFNKGMPNAQAKPIAQETKKAGVVRWKCDVHPWMRAYVGVNSNPYQAVTKDDGAFKIELPPGSYTLEAWHEKFGTKTVQVTVEAGKGATATFKFDGNEQTAAN
jgi:plastocyanin